MLKFGLQKEHIEVIEKEISRFEGAKYNHSVWNGIGEKIGWDAFTIALYYFKYAENKNKFIVSYTHEDYGNKVMYAEIEACSEVEAETIFFKKYDVLSDVIDIKHKHSIL